MKISHNIIAFFSFVAIFILLLIVAVVRGTLFEPSLNKSIVVSIFFAAWFALLVLCALSYGIPKLRVAPKNSRNQPYQKSVTSLPPTDERPRPSPRSDLPVRERISAYVEERRREEGIPAPVLLRPPRTTGVVVPAVSNIAQSMKSADGFFDDDDLELDSMGPEGMVSPDDFDLGDSFDSDEEDFEFGNREDPPDNNLPGLDGDPDTGSDTLDNNFDDFGDVGGDSFEASGGDELMDTDNSGNETGSLDGSGFDDFDDIGDDSFGASGGDELMDMDSAEIDDSMLGDNSMEGDGSLPDFDGDFDLSMADGDLTLADDDFGDIEEIGDLEP